MTVDKYIRAQRIREEITTLQRLLSCNKINPIEIKDTNYGNEHLITLSKQFMPTTNDKINRDFVDAVKAEISKLDAEFKAL